MWKNRLVHQDLRVYVAWESTSQRAFTLGRESKTGELLLPSLASTSLKHLPRAELLDCAYFFPLPFRNRF